MNVERAAFSSFLSVLFLRPNEGSALYRYNAALVLYRRLCVVFCLLIRRSIGYPLIQLRKMRRTGVTFMVDWV